MASVAAVLLLWHVGGRFGWVSPVILPSPEEVLDTAIDLAVRGYRQTPLIAHIGISLARALVAFAAAIAVGVPLGLAMGLSPTLAAALDPFVQFLRPLPKLTLIPLVIVWLGIGWTTLIAAEMVAADSGMGWMVINASSYMRTDIVVLGIFLLGLTGYLLDLAIIVLQRLMVPWAGRE